jgi:hypothetical protein
VIRDTDATYRCPRCGLTKPAAEYYRRSTYCIPCSKAYAKERRAATPEAALRREAKAAREAAYCSPERVCTRCGISKPTSEYSKHNKNGGLQYWCKECASNRQRQHTYGINPQQYQLQLQHQGNMCEICGSADPRANRKRFHVDHDHESLINRGLLCHHCNVALGMLLESPSLFRKAALYLETDHSDNFLNNPFPDSGPMCYPSSATKDY